MNTVFDLAGLFTALMIGCLAVGLWIVWKLTGINNKLKKW